MQRLVYFSNYFKSFMCVLILLMACDIPLSSVDVFIERILLEGELTKVGMKVSYPNTKCFYNKVFV